MNVEKLLCADCGRELSWKCKPHSKSVAVVGRCTPCELKEIEENNVTISIPALLKMLDDNEVLR